MLRPAVAATNWARAGIIGLDMRDGSSVLASAVPAGTSEPKCLPGRRPSTRGRGPARQLTRRWAEPLLEMRRLVVAPAAAEEQQQHEADANDHGEARSQRQRYVAFRRDRVALDGHGRIGEVSNRNQHSQQDDEKEYTHGAFSG